MKVQGRERAVWGFTLPVDGWHTVEMLEGIDYAKDKDTQEIRMDKKGEKCWLFPVKINDETDEANNARLNQFVYENNFGEQKIADILAGIGEFKNFDTAFPGDHSFFESAIMDKIKIKVPGKFLKMRTETSKDGKNVNVVEVAGLKVVMDDKKKKVVDIIPNTPNTATLTPTPPKQESAGW
jgi:hypothetical protein